MWKLCRSVSGPPYLATYRLRHYFAEANKVKLCPIVRTVNSGKVTMRLK